MNNKDTNHNSLKKATNMKELFNTFNPRIVLKEKDHDFFVNIFEDELKSFADDLIYSDFTKETFFVVGQIGNGKSSSLNMLGFLHPQILEKYDFKYIEGKRAFEYLPSIDVADILFHLAYEIIKDDDELSEEFTNALDELEKKHNNEIEQKLETVNVRESEINLKGSIGIGTNILNLFKSKVDFRAEYGLNEELRKSAVEFFRFKKQDLMKLLNDIILKYKIKNNKELIVVIDDLEKRDDVNHLFTQSYQFPLLNSLEIIKIIATPVYLARGTKLNFGEVKEFALKLKNKDNSPCEKDFDLLKQVINSRLGNKKLISEELIAKIIKSSGANINQLVYLMHKSALSAIESDFINEEDVESAIHTTTRSLSSFVQNQARFLDDIRNKKVDLSAEENLAKIQKATKNGVLFAYFNTDVWYKINPLCENSLDFHLPK